MGEMVKQRAGQPLQTEDTAPLVKQQVRCHRRGTMFIEPAKDFEQQFLTYRRERNIVQFIDNQQLDVSQLSIHSQPAHSRTRDLFRLGIASVVSADLLILVGEGRQLDDLEVIDQQHLRCKRGGHD